MIENLQFRFSNTRRLKRVFIMAEEFITGLLEPNQSNDYIFGYRFEDELGTIPPNTIVERFWFDYNPSSFVVLLSNRDWPEIPDGEYPPILNGGKLRMRQAFINKEKYREYNDTVAKGIWTPEAVSPPLLEYRLSDVSLDVLKSFRTRIDEAIYDKENPK